ncbi:MAG: hypothetical protein IPI27_05640 [Betaproteobacteria bacterium]|nr:hypothetical protein [Betaproteobacteria bacterium]
MRAVLDGALAPAFGPGVSSSTPPLSTRGVTRALAESLSARGVRLVDAPVTGGPAQAEGRPGLACRLRRLRFRRGAADRLPLLDGGAANEGVGAVTPPSCLNNFVTQARWCCGRGPARARDNGIDRQALYAVMGGARRVPAR